MSARPSWLTDDMLAEMRRLRGSSKGERKGKTGAFYPFDEADLAAHTSGTFWVREKEIGGVWLTEAGHAALHAIELELIGPLVDGTLRGEAPVTLSSEIMSELLHPEREEMDDDYDEEFIDYMTADMMPCGCTSDEQHERQRSAMESVSHMLEVVSNEDKMLKVRMKDGAGDGTMFVHESHLPKPTISKTETVAPSSSAPLTGWTQDWPTKPGWWWLRRDFDDLGRGVWVTDSVKIERDGLWAYWSAKGLCGQSDLPRDRVLWCRAIQPPEPPKATP